MNHPQTSNSFADVASSMLAGKYLTFKIGAEEYGLEIMKVQEIIGLLPITHVPRVPDYVRGIVNLRGRIVPTVDVRKKFGMPVVADTTKSCIIVVEVESGKGRLSVGLIVDEVAEVVHIDANHTDHVSHFAGNLPMQYILGVGVVNESVKMLLDIDKVMTFEEVKSLHQKAGTKAS